MINFTSKASYRFDDLVEIVRLLRSPGGCPWDREQTHASIRRNFIEETYEACEAIDLDDKRLLCEELGDVMLQVVFHAEMETEKGGFTIDDVADGICKKLILRHPHIFGEVRVHDSQEVLKNWDEIKKVEKGQHTVTDTLESVAKSLPSLIRAQKVQAKAAKCGFDWHDAGGAYDKVAEELEELKAAPAEKQEEELGDLLFSVVNVSRFLKIDPERACERTCNKFIARFSKMEALACGRGMRLEDMTLEQMDELWNEVKAQEVK